MNLMIRNDEACVLARELSDLTGESLEIAVIAALRERLGRLQAGETPLASRLTAIGKDCAKRLKEPCLSLDHGEFLYGEDGLPK